MCIIKGSIHDSESLDFHNESYTYGKKVNYTCSWVVYIVHTYLYGKNYTVSKKSDQAS